MRKNLNLILIGILLGFLLIGIVSADMVYTDTLQSGPANIVNSASVPAGSTNDNWFNITAYNIENTTGLSTIFITNAYLAYPSAPSNLNLGSPSTPITITYGAGAGLQTIGTGTLSATYISNATWPTASHNQIMVTLNSWNPGSLTGLVILNVSYTPSVFSYAKFQLANTYQISSTGLNGFVAISTNSKSAGYIYADVDLGVGCNIMNTYSYQFKNVVTATWLTSTNQFKIDVDRTIPPFMGTSDVNLTDGNGAGADAGFMSNDLTWMTYYTPIKVKVTEPRLGLTWTKYYFNPNYNLYLNPNNTVAGTSVSALLTANNLTLSGGLKSIQYYYINPSTSQPIYFKDPKGSLYETDYWLNGVTWYGWNESSQKYDNNKGSTMPNPINIIAPSLTGDVWIHANCVDIFDQSHFLRSIMTLPSGENYTIVNLDVKDSNTGSLIQDVNVGIYDVARNIWRNSTAPTGLVYFDSTGANYEYPLFVGSYIKLGAWANNYQYQDTGAFALPYSNYQAILNLVPTGGNISVGNFTLVVNTVRDKDGIPVSGESVSLDTGQIKTSNSGGASTFYNVSAGNHTITADHPYLTYERAVKSITGQAGETKIVVIRLVVTGETPAPVNTTPTLANGNVSASDLNASGSNLVLKFLQIAEGLSGLIALLVGIWFVRKTMKS